MMDELTFAPSKKSLSMDSFWCDEMTVSGTAAALERRLRKRTNVLWTKVAGDPDVDVLAARLESRRFSCVTARRIFKVKVFPPPPPPQKVWVLRCPKNWLLLLLFIVVVVVVHCCCCSLLLLLLLTFFQRESSDIKKTQNDSHFLDFCELFVFPSFLPSFLPSQKKLQIEAPLTHRHQSSTWPRYERREHSFHSRARFSRSLSRSRKKEGRARRTGGCGNVLRARTWCPRKKFGGRERKMFPHPFEKGRAKDGCEGRAFGWTTTWCWNDASGRVVILVARFWGHHPCHSRG